MRLLSFSLLKNNSIKPFCYRITRLISSGSIPAETEPGKVLGDPTLIEISPSWPQEEEPALRASVLNTMQVLPDFVTEYEEQSLVAELEPYLKRMRYEFDHWDNAIQGYRETERSHWSPENEAIIQRITNVAFQDTEPLPHTHVLDLAAGGHIKPHVDAVRFCGEVIAGLCLLSSAVMRLEHCQKKHLTLDALLQQRALYIMRGAARYEFTHAVVGGAGSEWRGERVPRRRRVALIRRSRP